MSEFRGKAIKLLQEVDEIAKIIGSSVLPLKEKNNSFCILDYILLRYTVSFK
jgi:hypothetical protein